MSLFAHQAKIIGEDPEQTGIFTGTGSGKTRVALILARGNTLVIAPKTQVEDRNWQREFEKIFDLLSTTRLDVISKEAFRRDHKKIPRYDTVIGDEAHTLLGVTPNVRWEDKKPIPKTSQLFEALNAYIEKRKPSRFYLCTATIMRSPMTVWGAARVLGYGVDWYEFRERFYFRLPMPGREVWVPKNDDATKDSLAKIVRELGYVGRLEDFFDVPEQTFKNEYIELTAAQKKRIKEMTIEYPDPIVRIGKVHQIENGVLAGDKFNRPELFDNGKIEKILEYMIEFPQMIVFAKYSGQIAQIAAAVEKAGRKAFRLEGETKDRGGLLKQAKMTPEYVFIAQAQISAGWELPDCPVMIFASRTNSFVDYDQGLGRIQRADNIKKNLYINLIARSVYEGTGKNRRQIGGTDEAVDRSLENKCDFNERIYLNV